jgi:hypothetical protein
MDNETILDTAELLAVVDSLPPAPDALLRRYAPTVQQFEGRYILVDKIKRKRRVAPFVSPYVAGKPSPRTGRALEAIEPAYIKDTKVIEPGESTIRAFGEALGGDGRTGAQRIDDAIALELKESRDAWVRRLETMAMQALKEGKITLAGDQYPTTVVDFKRNSALKIADQSSTLAWSHADARPLERLREWATLALKHGDQAAIDVIFGADAFGLFLSHATVGDRFKAAQPTNIALTPQVPTAEGLVFQGTCEGLNIFTYVGWFEDPTNNNTVTEIWPAPAVAVTSPNWAVQAFGGIKDGKAGYAALPFFPKMWENNDPADVILQCQSAPMVVPTNVDAACVCKDVDA